MSGARERFLKSIFAAVMAFALSLQGASAAVVISTTRVVYPSHSREVTVRLTNTSNGPVLVDAWIDQDKSMKSEGKAAPFLLTPPLFRLNAGKGQTLRIFRAPSDLSQDRESLFWLNVLEVPPDPPSEESRLKISVRSRIKFFYRPAGLEGDVRDAPRKLVWKFQKKDGDEFLRVENPSPFYITVASVTWGDEVPSKGKWSKKISGDMVEPFGHLDIPVPADSDLRPISVGAELGFEVINDQGGLARHVTRVFDN